MSLAEAKAMPLIELAEANDYLHEYNKESLRAIEGS